MTNKPIPTLDPKAPATCFPAKNGFHYKPKFGLIIECDDEPHQQTVFEHLKSLGYKAKVVVV